VTATFVVRESGSTGGSGATAGGSNAGTAHRLAVAKSGQGSVSSTPAGISCGSDCEEDYAAGTVVALSATPQSGWTFSGWSGACSGSGTCSTTMDSARSVTAAFEALPTYDLTVSISAGSGAVTSAPAGISCSSAGGDCLEAYTNGTLVTLTADPSGFLGLFIAWGGACAGTIGTTCNVTMSSAQSVTATFSI
jgi:hypothetical protein